MSKLFTYREPDVATGTPLQSHPWDFIRSKEGGQILRRDCEKMPSVSQYNVMAGERLQGRVFTFDAALEHMGLMRSGSLPFDINGLVGENGTSLLEKLSENKLKQRMGYSYSERQDNTSAEIYGARRTGCTINHLGWFGEPESFRKHVLVLNDKPSFMDFKIPGEDDGHLRVSIYTFEAGVELAQERLKRDKDPKMAMPLMYVMIPNDFKMKLYGIDNYQVDDAKPWYPHYMVMEHLDGLRLIRGPMKPSVRPDLLSMPYVKRVSKLSGRPVEEMLGDALLSPMQLVDDLHDIGFILGADNHYQNHSLCTDGIVRAATDLGSSRRPKDIAIGDVHKKTFDKDWKRAQVNAEAFLKLLSGAGIKPSINDGSIPSRLPDADAIYSKVDII